MLAPCLFSPKCFFFYFPGPSFSPSMCAYACPTSANSSFPNGGRGIVFFDASNQAVCFWIGPHAARAPCTHSSRPLIHANPKLFFSLPPLCFEKTSGFSLGKKNSPFPPFHLPPTLSGSFSFFFSRSPHTERTTSALFIVGLATFLGVVRRQLAILRFFYHSFPYPNLQGCVNVL